METLPENSQRKCYVGRMQTLFKEHREEIFKDHIMGHNRYMRDEYYMKTEELAKLLSAGSYDAALTAVGEHEEKQRELNRQHLEVRRRFGTT